jgi:hypothetical protein
VLPTDPLPAAPLIVTGLSNQEFLTRYARGGCVGLSGGVTLVDKAICRAERHLHAEARWGVWSHAFLFQGLRADGHHWVIESDLQIQHKHIQLGVQENRITKYFNEQNYTTLAVLDFGLTEAQTRLVIAEGLEMVETRTRYSLRELVGTLIALRRRELRGTENILARDRSVYCSAFVQHLFRKAGVDLAPGVEGKNTTPEDISRTSVPHTMYLLEREVARSALRILGRKIRHRVKARVKLLQRKSGGAGAST